VNYGKCSQQENKDVLTQKQVSRVINYFDDLDESSVKIRKRQDRERTVVFMYEYVKRVFASQNMNHDVVSETTSKG